MSSPARFREIGTPPGERGDGVEEFEEFKEFELSGNPEEQILYRSGDGDSYDALASGSRRRTDVGVVSECPR